MKLVLCRKCYDVVKLGRDKAHTHYCECRAVGGYYLEDLLHAEFFGGEIAVPLGFANSSLTQAALNQPEMGWGKNFEAFVIPKNCPTLKMVDHPIVEKRKKSGPKRRKTKA